MASPRKEALRRIVEDVDTPAGRRFDLVVQAVIVLSLLAYAIETLPRLAMPVRRALVGIEVASVVWFSCEYVLRCWVAKPRRSYVFSFFGLVDLLSVLPFFLALGFDLRVLRALRLMRLFRLLKLGRYSRAVRRFHMAFRIAKEEVVLFLALTAVLMFLAAAGIHHFEHEAQPEAFASIFHGLWWAVATLTTVGYGDVYPVTAGGKVFTFVTLLIGLGVVAVPAGLVASALAKARELEDEDTARKDNELLGR